MNTAKAFVFFKILSCPGFTVCPHLGKHRELEPFWAFDGVVFGFRNRPNGIGVVILKSEYLAHVLAAIAGFLNSDKTAVEGKAKFYNLLAVQFHHVPRFVHSGFNCACATKTTVSVVVMDHDDRARRKVFSVPTSQPFQRMSVFAAVFLVRVGVIAPIKAVNHHKRIFLPLLDLAKLSVPLHVPLSHDINIGSHAPFLKLKAKHSLTLITV